MASITQHPPPRWSTIAAEQVRAVAVALRKEAIIFGVLWVLMFALALRAAFTSVGAKPRISMAYTAGLGFPLVVIAFFIPLSIWRAEDPARRAYHWAMPIPRTRHALIKAMAGLAAVTVTVSVYLLFTWILAVSVNRITNNTPRYHAPAWEWIVPFTASAIAYFAGSAITIGVRHPSRWLLGVVPAALIGNLFASTLGLVWLHDLVVTAWQGEYGLSSALGTSIQDATGAANIARWSTATLLWGSASVLALIVAARRHMEEH